MACGVQYTRYLMAIKVSTYGTHVVFATRRLRLEQAHV